MIITAFACAAALGACGSAPADTGKLEDLKKRMEQEAEENKKKEEKKDETAEKQEEPEDKEPEKEIENSGGLFVKVGNRVYFRIYDKRSLGLTTMGGPFISETGELPSKLMYYDLDTDETKEVCELRGSGPLFASDEGLLLADHTNGTTTLIREDGTIEEGYYKECISADPSEGNDEEEHRPGDVYLSNKNYGDLVAHTYDGEDVVIYKDYIYEPGEYDMFADAIEGAVCFSDDVAFVIRTSGDKSPEEGKWAYDLSKLMFECIRFDEEHMTDGRPKYSFITELSSAGWDKGEIEYDELVGTWQMKSANVEGFQYDDYTDSDIVTRIDFNEDASAVVYSFDTRSGEKKGDDNTFIQMRPDEEGPDYAYRFADEDDGNAEDPGTIGVCFLSNGRLGIMNRYHYDGNSVGWYKGSFYKVQ